MSTKNVTIEYDCDAATRNGLLSAGTNNLCDSPERIAKAMIDLGYDPHGPAVGHFVSRINVGTSAKSTIQIFINS